MSEVRLLGEFDPPLLITTGRLRPIKVNRYCSCGRKALTPDSYGRKRMRKGWVCRKGHDLCAQCWRDLYNALQRFAPNGGTERFPDSEEIRTYA